MEPATVCRASSLNSLNMKAAAQIIDIRVDTAYSDLVADIKQGIRPKDGGEKKLPTLLLYDEQGLRLFEKITYLEQYYLTNAEIEVLEDEADRIAKCIPHNSVLVELGSGYDSSMPFATNRSEPQASSILIRHSATFARSTSCFKQ